MYKVISVLFWFIRQYCMPNPFEKIEIAIDSPYSNIYSILMPEMLNALAGSILVPFTYFIVGFYYTSGSNPVVGSIYYMFFYIIHTGFLHLFVEVSPDPWWFAIIVLYFLLHVVLKRIIEFVRNVIFPS